MSSSRISRAPSTSSISGKARLGLYLGQSPMHSKDVVLVLSLETGLVSPQFHVKLDSSFKSLKEAETL